VAIAELLLVSWYFCRQPNGRHQLGKWPPFAVVKALHLCIDNHSTWQPPSLGSSLHLEHVLMVVCCFMDVSACPAVSDI
jgi:hypothetical protein